MNIYDFENKGRRKFPDIESENKALSEFAQRLELQLSDFNQNRELLLNFILNHHKIIQRYMELICDEKSKQNSFRYISLFLLFLIPILIYLGPIVFNGSSNIDFPAQIATMLTGLLTIQKSLSSWLDKRKIVGNFQKAQSDLKSKLYAFEDKWRGQAKELNTNKLKVDFLQEIRLAIREAQMIVEEEQNLYYEAITNPSIDIGAILADARKSTVANVGDLIPSQSESKKQALLEKKKSIIVLENEISLRKSLIAEKRLNISPENKDSLEAEITTENKKILQLEDALIKAKSELEALLHMQSI